MKSFKEHLKTYYHGTSDANAKNITKYGLDPKHSLFKKVYLTKSYGEASKYSKIANNGKLGVIFAIDGNALKAEDIEKDYNGIIEYTGKVDAKHIRMP